MAFIKKDYSKFSWRGRKRDKSVQEQHAELLKGTMQIPGYLMYINKGQDDEMEIRCFKISKPKIFITYLATFLTGGILRLIFHWIPHWYVFATCDKCVITEAEKILVKEIFGGKHTIYHVKNLKILTPESVRKLKDEESLLNHVTDGEVAGLAVHFENGNFRELDKYV